MQKVHRLLHASGIALILGAAGVVRAATTPVFNYSYPASWPGTGTTVTDQSAAGNNAVTNGTPSLTATVPPGVSSGTGTESLVSNTGGMQTTAKLLLNNPAIAAAGGYTYTADFMWDGTDNSNHIEKIIDYAGTESLQLDTIVAGTSANLHLGFNDDGTSGPSTSILPNKWYQVSAVFDTTGNSVDGSGNITGLASLTTTDLTDAGLPVFTSIAATKDGASTTNSGDNLNRPIGVGELGFTGVALVLFHGDIYNPTVSLGVVPEPASMALLGLTLPMLLRRRSR